jgi:hypothetical protein
MRMSKIPKLNDALGGEHPGIRCSIMAADQLGIEQWEYEALSAIHRDDAKAIADCAARLRLRLT